MPLVKLPITNVVTGGDYTGVLAVGANQARLAVIVDTGSSTLVVDGQHVDPAASPDTRTTNLAQTVQYGAGGWVGAVVQTSVSLGAAVTLPVVQLAVTYGESANLFGRAHGILGLAYAPLDVAYVLPADTWASRYDVAQIVASPVVELDPYFSQLEQAGVVANKFAFCTRRSTTSLATDDPSTDPQNHGVLVIGGGEEATELYSGDFTQIAVVDDRWYNTTLLGVQVGSQPMIAVAPLPAGSPLASNSIVDSGTNTLRFTQALYDQIIAAFGAIDPGFATALGAHAVGVGPGVDQAQLELAAWPDLHLTLQGANGDPATLTVTPAHYWQFDAAAKGAALAYLDGDGGQGGGQTILGLPLFSGYYTVFDRALGAGRGVISFAARV